MPTATGARHHAAVLTEEDARSIRTIHARGNASRGALARRYGTMPQAVDVAVTNRTWKHVEDEQQPGVRDQ